MQDVDDFFEHEKNYLVEYHNHIREATAKSDRMTRAQKGFTIVFFQGTFGETTFIFIKFLLVAMADCFIKIAGTIESLATMEKNTELHKYEQKMLKLKTKNAIDNFVFCL